MTDKKTEKICIFTDSASDITHEEAERWDVKVAPMQCVQPSSCACL